MKNLIKLLFITIILSTVVMAQNKDYSKLPGYVEFGNFTEFESGDEVTEIYLDENLLNMAAKFTQNSDPEAYNLISGLKLIKVNSFNVEIKNYGEIENRINKIDKELVKNNWNRIVKTKTSNETANIYIKNDKNNKINGLVVTTIDKNGSASFINIVGNIDLEDISKLSTNFNIPQLDSIKKK